MWLHVVAHLFQAPCVCSPLTGRELEKRPSWYIAHCWGRSGSLGCPYALKTLSTSANSTPACTRGISHDADSIRQPYQE